MGITVLGAVISAVVIGALALVWRVVVKKFFPGPTKELLGIPGTGQQSVSVEKWQQEEAGFRDASAHVWTTLIQKFEKDGYFGLGSARSGLSDTVKLAPWPDQNVEQLTPASLGRSVLDNFCDRVCARSGERLFGDTKEFLEFDSARRDLSRLLREWSARRKDKAFVEWLRDKLPWPRATIGTPPPYHYHTVKLAWYLELATARESGNETADYAFVATLRDALSEKPPIRLGVDGEGYLTELPPERGT